MAQRPTWRHLVRHAWAASSGTLVIWLDRSQHPVVVCVCLWPRSEVDFATFRQSGGQPPGTAPFCFRNKHLDCHKRCGVGWASIYSSHHYGHEDSPTCRKFILCGRAVLLGMSWSYLGLKIRRHSWPQSTSCLWLCFVSSWCCSLGGNP